MAKVVGNENDLVRRGDVLKDIEELDMIDTVDGRGRPVNKEDIRIQMYGTVIYTKKTDAIPVDWIQRYINACEMVSVMDGGAVTKWSADAVKAMLECWREEQTPTCGPDYCDINFGGGTKA